MIRFYVEDGRFASPSEVVSAGIRLLEEQAREDEAKLERLRVEVRKGLDDLEAGRCIDVDYDGELDAYLDTASNEVIRQAPL